MQMFISLNKHFSKTFIGLYCCTMLAGCGAGDPSPVALTDLKCEYLNDPLGLDAEHPRLSWIIHSDDRSVLQSAYQVMAATDEQLLYESKPDLWNSDKVLSGRSIQVPYEGKPLRQV